MTPIALQIRMAAFLPAADIMLRPLMKAILIRARTTIRMQTAYGRNIPVLQRVPQFAKQRHVQAIRPGPAVLMPASMAVKKGFALWPLRVVRRANIVVAQTPTRWERVVVGQGIFLTIRICTESTFFAGP